MMSSFASGDSKVKRPNVSGQFYPADPKELSREVDGFIQKAAVEPQNRHIDIVIAPHAGYSYSGAVAGYSFKAVSQNQYSTIVILAPSHFVGFEAISVWDEGAFETPLGRVEVDESFTKKLISANKSFYFYPQAFAKEHSLEVEIPFLQKTFKGFKIVPVVMGQPEFETLKAFASSLKKIIGNRQDVLIVVSTDMSHYHPDSVARQMDFQALHLIKELKVEEIWQQSQARRIEMCGFIPVTTALLYAKEQGLNQVEVLRYTNSGDVTGDLDQVVGYSSVIIYKGEGNNSPLQEKKAQEDDSLNLSQKRRLIEIAKSTIKEYVTAGNVLQFKENDPRLNEEKGAFVTIHKAGNLHGCIGNIIGGGPLYLTVRDMAIAATEDERFVKNPLKREELKDIEIEVSVLSKPRAVKDIKEIKLGTHGVILSQGRHHGVFLPQVATDTGWSKEEFLSQLCAQKAGLPPDAWKNPKTKIEIFTADVFSEKDLRE